MVAYIVFDYFLFNKVSSSKVELLMKLTFTVMEMVVIVIVLSKISLGTANTRIFEKININIDIYKNFELYINKRI